MKTLVLIFGLLSTSISMAKINSAHCQPEALDGPFIFSDDFRWDYSLTEMRDKFNEIYSSQKRLKKRAYYDQKSEQIILPFIAAQGGNIVITEKFVNSVARHIEDGFKKNIVDGVFFPDMGHSHLFIPLHKFDTIYSKFEPNQFNQFYQKLFADPDLKILYHTAEQLKMRDENGELIQDSATQHRYQTRNLVGPNSLEPIFTIQNLESPANTARDLEGHHYWGAGFNLSASANGCFSYQINGQSFNFDLSMFDLESSNSGEEF